MTKTPFLSASEFSPIPSCESIAFHIFSTHESKTMQPTSNTAEESLKASKTPLSSPASSSFDYILDQFIFTIHKL